MPEGAEKVGFVTKKQVPLAIQEFGSISPREPETQIQFLTDSQMLPAYVGACEDIKCAFDAMLYMVNNQVLCAILCRKIQEKSVKGRMILDKDCFPKRNTWGTKRPRVQELRLAGCELRQLKPQHGVAASLHAKSWVLDGTVVLTGSVNTTGNSMNNN